MLVNFIRDTCPVCKTSDWYFVWYPAKPRPFQVECNLLYRKEGLSRHLTYRTFRLTVWCVLPFVVNGNLHHGGLLMKTIERQKVLKWNAFKITSMLCSQNCFSSGKFDMCTGYFESFQNRGVMLLSKFQTLLTFVLCFISQFSCPILKLDLNTFDVVSIDATILSFTSKRSSRNHSLAILPFYLPGHKIDILQKTSVCEISYPKRFTF